MAERLVDAGVTGRRRLLAERLELPVHGQLEPVRDVGLASASPTERRCRPGNFDACPDQYGSWGGVAAHLVREVEQQREPALTLNTSAENSRYNALLGSTSRRTHFVVDTSRKALRSVARHQRPSGEQDPTPRPGAIRRTVAPARARPPTRPGAGRRLPVDQDPGQIGRRSATAGRTAQTTRMRGMEDPMPARGSARWRSRWPDNAIPGSLVAMSTEPPGAVRRAHDLLRLRPGQPRRAAHPLVPRSDGQTTSSPNGSPSRTTRRFAGVINGGIIGTLMDCHSNWTAA